MAMVAFNAFFHPFHQRDKETFELALNREAQKIPHFIGSSCTRALYGIVRAIVGIAGAVFYGLKYLYTKDSDDKKRVDFSFFVEIPAGLGNILRAVAEITWYIDKWVAWTENDTLIFCSLDTSDILYVPTSFRSQWRF